MPNWDYVDYQRIVRQAHRERSVAVARVLLGMLRWLKADRRPSGARLAH